MSTTVGSGARISLSCMKSLCMSYVPRNQKYKNNLTLQGCGLITSNAGLRISHFKEWTQEIIWRYIYIHLHTFTICRCLNHLDFSCLIFSYFSYLSPMNTLSKLQCPHPAVRPASAAEVFVPVCWFRSASGSMHPTWPTPWEAQGNRSCRQPPPWRMWQFLNWGAGLWSRKSKGTFSMFNSHCNILKCYFPILSPYSTT